MGLAYNLDTTLISTTLWADIIDNDYHKDGVFATARWDGITPTPESFVVTKQYIADEVLFLIGYYSGSWSSAGGHYPYKGVTLVDGPMTDGFIACCNIANTKDASKWFLLPTRSCIEIYGVTTSEPSVPTGQFGFSIAKATTSFKGRFTGGETAVEAIYLGTCGTVGFNLDLAVTDSGIPANVNQLANMYYWVVVRSPELGADDGNFGVDPSGNYEITMSDMILDGRLPSGFLTPDSYSFIDVFKGGISLYPYAQITPRADLIGNDADIDPTGAGINFVPTNADWNGGGNMTTTGQFPYRIAVRDFTTHNGYDSWLKNNFQNIADGGNIAGRSTYRDGYEIGFYPKAWYDMESFFDNLTAHASTPSLHLFNFWMCGENWEIDTTNDAVRTDVTNPTSPAFLKGFVGQTQAGYGGLRTFAVSTMWTRRNLWIADADVDSGGVVETTSPYGAYFRFIQPSSDIIVENNPILITLHTKTDITGASALRAELYEFSPQSVYVKPAGYSNDGYFNANRVGPTLHPVYTWGGPLETDSGVNLPTRFVGKANQMRTFTKGEELEGPYVFNFPVYGFGEEFTTAGVANGIGYGLTGYSTRSGSHVPTAIEYDGGYTKVTNSIADPTDYLIRGYQVQDVNSISLGTQTVYTLPMVDCFTNPPITYEIISLEVEGVNLCAAHICGVGGNIAYNGTLSDMAAEINTRIADLIAAPCNFAELDGITALVSVDGGGMLFSSSHGVGVTLGALEFNFGGINPATDTIIPYDLNNYVWYPDGDNGLGMNYLYFPDNALNKLETAYPAQMAPKDYGTTISNAQLKPTGTATTRTITGSDWDNDRDQFLFCTSASSAEGGVGVVSVSSDFLNVLDQTDNFPKLAANNLLIGDYTTRMKTPALDGFVYFGSDVDPTTTDGFLMIEQPLALYQITGSTGRTARVFVDYILFDGVDAAIAVKLKEMGVRVTIENVEWYKTKLLHGGDLKITQEEIEKWMESQANEYRDMLKTNERQGRSRKRRKQVSGFKQPVEDILTPDFYDKEVYDFVPEGAAPSDKPPDSTARRIAEHFSTKPPQPKPKKVAEIPDFDPTSDFDETNEEGDEYDST
jgi:hypothetical protein